MARNLTLKLTRAQHSALSGAIDYQITICEDQIALESEAKSRNQWIGRKKALQNINIKMWK